MKLINQSYEILGTPQSLEEAWSFVAKAARNCYQSQKTKPDESEEDFCKRLLLKNKDNECNHLSPLEFGIVYLHFTKDCFEKTKLIDSRLFGRWEKYYRNPYSRYYNPNYNDFYITTNLRVIIENGWEDDLRYAGAPTEYHIKACCFKFDTSIHVYKDLTRHEGALSFAIESTRYCKYTNPKFGSGLTFIWHPKLAKYSAEELHLNEEGIFNNNFEGLPGEVATLFKGFISDEQTYSSLINEYGWTAQDAATKLPQDTKATVMMCGYTDNLHHMFRLRAEECSGPVLPQVAELMKPMYQDYMIWRSN